MLCSDSTWISISKGNGKKIPRKEYENVIRYITSMEYVPKSIHQEIIEMNQDIIDLRNTNEKKEKNI